jgi:hypothetical protein
MLKTYVKRQLAQVGETVLSDDYILIEDADWSVHPAFREAGAAKEPRMD